MNTDRELLELAAKAAGIPFYSYVDTFYDGPGLYRDEEDTPLWNALTCDGDAMRLVVKLRLLVNVGEFNAEVCSREPQIDVSEPLGQDPCAATRRAIVRAAAEIARL